MGYATKKNAWYNNQVQWDEIPVMKARITELDGFVFNEKKNEFLLH